MTVAMAARSLDVDLLARELGNWRTSSRSGPAYHGLADAVRLLIVDGRLPVGARLPSERALAEALRVSRTTVTAAYAQLRDDGYLNARRGRAQHHGPARRPRRAGTRVAPPTLSLAAAALVRSGGGGDDGVRRGGQRRDALPAGHGPRAGRRRRAAAGDRRKILRAWTSHRARRDHGDHRRVARHRPDPDHLHPARRPGPGRAAHLSRRAVGDHDRRGTSGAGVDDRGRLGPRRAGRGGAINWPPTWPT